MSMHALVRCEIAPKATARAATSAQQIAGEHDDPVSAVTDATPAHLPVLISAGALDDRQASESATSEISPSAHDALLAAQRLHWHVTGCPRPSCTSW
jgi:hypothetical protein